MKVLTINSACRIESKKNMYDAWTGEWINAFGYDAQGRFHPEVFPPFPLDVGPTPEEIATSVAHRLWLCANHEESAYHWYFRALCDEDRALKDGLSEEQRNARWVSNVEMCNSDLLQNCKLPLSNDEWERLACQVWAELVMATIDIETLVAQKCTTMRARWCEVPAEQRLDWFNAECVTMLRKRRILPPAIIGRTPILKKVAAELEAKLRRLEQAEALIQQRAEQFAVLKTSMSPGQFEKMLEEELRLPRQRALQAFNDVRES